jgi:UDP-N-acetylmuramoyl-tripeptide--D-alanyl-D-alanine ligase
LIGDNFLKNKTTRNDIHQFKLFDNLKSKLVTSQIKDKFILIKGSRGMALERILELI